MEDSYNTQPLQPDEIASEATRLLGSIREEMDQAENLIDQVKQSIHSGEESLMATLGLFEEQLNQIAKGLLGLLTELAEHADHEQLQASKEQVQDFQSRIEFLEAELEKGGHQIDIIIPYKTAIERLSELLPLLEEEPLGQAEAIDKLLQQLNSILESEAHFKLEEPDKEQMIKQLEELATLVIESDSMDSYRNLLLHTLNRGVELQEVDEALQEPLMNLESLREQEEERLAAYTEKVRKELQDVIWKIDTNASLSDCKEALLQVEELIQQNQNLTLELMGGDFRHLALKIDELKANLVAATAQLNESNEQNESEESSYGSIEMHEHENRGQTTSPDPTYDTPEALEKPSQEIPDLTPTPMEEQSTSMNTSAMEALEQKLSEIEARLKQKADRNELSSASVSAGSGYSEDLNAEMERLRRRMSDLEELAASPGDINESLLRKQINSVQSELSVMDKQTRMLLTDLNQRVESAVLKHELSGRLREFTSRDQLREVEQGLRDRNMELRSEIKLLQEELAKRPAGEQMRKMALEVFRDERQAEEFVERFELKSIESTIDQLSERISKKVDLETIKDFTANFIDKDALQNELKLLEMHKNETRLFLLDMQEKLKTIPDYQALVDNFVSQQAFEDLAKKRAKALGELRLDVGVALEKAENAVSSEQLDAAIEQIKQSIPDLSVFKELRELVEQSEQTLQKEVATLREELSSKASSQELDQLAKVVEAQVEQLKRVPVRQHVDEMIAAKVQELESKAATKDQAANLREQQALLESDLQSIRTHHESLQEVLKVIRSDIKDLDINKESFIQSFNEELRVSLFKMISEYDASLQHDLEEKLKKWKEYHEGLKQEQLDEVLKFLNEEVYKSTTEFKDRMERNVAEQVSTHNDRLSRTRMEMEEVVAEKKTLLEDLRRARQDLSELDYLKKESVREFREELRRAKAEIFDHSESGMRQYYDEQIDKLRRSYEEKNEQILDLLSESRGDWFSQNLMGIIAVLMSGVAIALGINSLL